MFGRAFSFELSALSYKNIVATNPTARVKAAGSNRKPGIE
jgi:hypothetical protein